MRTTRAKSPKNGPRKRLGRHIALVALIATLGVLGPTGGGVAQATGTHRAATSTVGPCVDGKRSVTIQGKTIIARCGGAYGQGWTYHVYDGRIHYFVVRDWDRAVSHIWQTCSTCSTFSNWTPLGWESISSVTATNYTSRYGALSLVIRVTASDGRYWYRNYNHDASGTWGGWHP
jgi:hypothetical protein